MPRFYVPDIAYKVGEEVVLPPEAIHHAMRVLRMREDDEAELFDGNGKSAKGTIHFAKDFASVKILETAFTQENSLKIVLLQSLVSNEKMDWIVEKACELGVTELIVFPADRSEVKLIGDKLLKRIERWNKIVVSACKQCKRSALLKVSWLPSLQDFNPEGIQKNFIMIPQATLSEKAEKKIESVSFAIGPEGGLSQREIQLLMEKGFEPKQLGQFVFRTETAGIVAASYAHTLWDWN